MIDSETKARRCAKRKLAHRATTLRKMADELDAIAVQLDGDEFETASNEKDAGPPS